MACFIVADWLCRYQNVASLVARQLWEEAHLESERQQGVGSRLRELQLLSGLVLPIWPEVEMCLSQEVRASQRRLNVMRLETTGEALTAGKGFRGCRLA